ncbi:hypothetical protein [Chryseosolibacter indicus]|uniref:Uncharacterized protein n=1 Tax=Chryseosolibacter indicus TaxID=2782351 RepID=A0ABS5VQZ5_9BACT|nr:hypothetical protein [Chryseosolibacter indicus]MBT1703875.1 hypothetical protein [Chryseosolibacter indicus]
MSGAKLKEHLLKIASEVTEITSLDEVYEQLALLNDIEESELEDTRGETISHQEVIDRSKEWLMK